VDSENGKKMKQQKEETRALAGSFLFLPFHMFLNLVP
jgi:hypothetical protein